MNHVRPHKLTNAKSPNGSRLGDQHLRELLHDRIMGFRATQMIHVAAKLGLADRLAAGPRSAGDLAAAVGAEPQALHRLLRALAGIGIFAEDEAGDFMLTPQAELLRSDVQGSLRDMALLYGEDWLWQTYGAMMHSVRTGAPAFVKTHGQPLYGYLHEHPRAAAQFNAAMGSFSNHETAAILEAYDFATARNVVDIGGGHGALLAALLRAHPHLAGILFDLPSVVAGAMQVLGETGIAERARCVAGDFFDEAPGGADLYVMKSVLHNWEDGDAARILSTCRAAMKPGARLLVIERVVPVGNAPAEAKLFDINMMVVAGGRERTEIEYRLLFEEAGLALERAAATRSPLSLLVATVR
ncbi:MAG TPA: methyltransferase [Dongiaceae bacterium]|jgi:SAM-dependent methyltransferase|nr:methyltransferase [Dongiaceae bacterium]